MNDRDQRRYDRLPRIQTFGSDNAADFTAGSKALTLFARIGQHIIDLDLAKAGQRPDRVSKETLLDAVRLDLKNIARTARSIDIHQHGFAAAYRLPGDLTESNLTTHADAVLHLLESLPADSPSTATAKAALRAKFLAYEIPADFVEDLRADREAIRTANQHNQGENLEGVEDTASIGQILGLAAKDVQELDAIMHNKYARNPAKLAAWKSASHTERAPVRAKPPATPPTP